MIAPAMDCDMYAHSATQANVCILQERGHVFVEPDEGELASGLTGKGRMAEPERIVKEIASFFEQKNELKGNKVLVTAGPTFEAIDPVRFIGNHSTGKMGYAIARELADKGADVILVSGPVSLKDNHPKIKTIEVTSAEDMLKSCRKHFPTCKGAVMAAAVADYTPEKAEKNKISGKDKNLTLTLKPTTDIAAELGKMKKKNQFLVGFALETQNETKNAQRKISDKNLDFIVLNSLNDKGAGFGHDTNKISILYKNNKRTDYQLKHKNLVAKDIVHEILRLNHKS
ncbi:MAG: bifunctional phosphopantothenoylcysteine decarboxylase/phosphopantothenate--cysteine ligase CoaBC [Bacteroidetes bacterium HGW-Bacteroidetes-21]|nr:MAG: bifunctional phosphopantothenoylcysteine decarboxylase/phosphopantothenate--cysteine ligase CoaBC [Bacteroidetes bacterium HGW-Bacteroidetes-21]